MKESKIIIFLYTTVLGRAILKILVNPKLSIAMASVMSSPISRLAVPRFIRKNNIDIECYDIPEGGYRSFNDFFTRKKKEEHISHNNGILSSPCDALLTVSPINENSIFNIKHTEYSVGSLLADDKLGEEYVGGTAFIFRLTPAHYHRYNFCADGYFLYNRKIQGVLHSVQPVCHEQTDVFIQNSREYVVIDNNDLGKLIQMEIGALLVGKITNHPVDKNSRIDTGIEKGYFEYGGSSIVVLSKKKLTLSEEITNRVRAGDEIPVCIGEIFV